jgi:hypothetical protein
MGFHGAVLYPAGQDGWRRHRSANESDRADRRFRNPIQLVMIAGQQGSIFQQCESEGDTVGQGDAPPFGLEESTT